MDPKPTIQFMCFKCFYINQSMVSVYIKYLNLILTALQMRHGFDK